MKVKGHSSIELKDAQGNVERFDNDNMITNGLRDFINTYGAFSNDTLSVVDNSPLWESLLGGIMLFNNQLTEEVTNTMLNAGNIKMIGCGCYGLSNSDSVSEMGSYNALESGVQSDGSIKLVYDYTTAQANGTIKSVALTTQSGGYVGCGNGVSGSYHQNQSFSLIGDNLQKSYASRKVPDFDISTMSNKAYSYFFMCGDYNKDIICYIKPSTILYRSEDDTPDSWWNTGHITIKKVKANMKSVSIKSCLDLTEEVESIDINIPDEIRNFIGSASKLINYQPYAFYANGNIYISFGLGSTLAGNYCYVIRIDSQMNATTHKVYNNTDTALYFNDIDCCFAVDNNDNMLVMDSSQKRMFKINIIDSTQVTEIERCATTTVRYTFADGNYIYCTNMSVSTVIDTTANKEYYINNSYGGTPDGTHYIPVVGIKSAYIRVYCDFDTRLALTKMINTLMTVNNLSTPVTKTTGKTMKVIYTLTFEDD